LNNVEISLSNNTKVVKYILSITLTLILYMQWNENMLEGWEEK